MWNHTFGDILGYTASPGQPRLHNEMPSQTKNKTKWMIHLIPGCYGNKTDVCSPRDGNKVRRGFQVPGLEALGPFGALKEITVYSRQSSPQPTPGETDSSLPLGVPLRHTALPSSADKDAAS